MAIGSEIASKAGLVMPTLPPGADMGAIQRTMPGVSLLLVLALMPISRRIRGDYLTRWVMIALFSWVCFGAVTAIEASLFTTGFAAGNSAFLLMHGISLLMTAGFVAWLCPPRDAKNRKTLEAGPRFRALIGRDGIGWLAVASLIYVPVYYFFGFLLAMLAPGIIDYYRQDLFNLRLPGPWEILPVQAVKSGLFLLACLPILLAWKPGDRFAWVWLGGALFVLTGLIGMVQANWYPFAMRTAHGAELFADSMAYAFLVTAILAKPLNRRGDLAG
jgi:hypothetical protein